MRAVTELNINAPLATHCYSLQTYLLQMDLDSEFVLRHRIVCQASKLPMLGLLGIRDAKIKGVTDNSLGR